MKTIRLFITLMLCLVGYSLHGNNYTVKVGESLDITCTATPPAGYITHAFFSLANSDDGAYLAVYSHSSDCYATVTGISAKANIKIEVTYAYSYIGSYDNRTHVGSATYYEYVTVTGGKTPTDIKVTPSDPEMGVGETIQLNAILTPSDASTSFVWAMVNSLGAPYNFTLTSVGPVATVTSKGPGKLYIIVQTANGLNGAAVVTAVKKDIPVESISFKEEELIMDIGKKTKLKYTLYPSGASSELVWISSNENVATVSDAGIVTAVGVGTCNITVMTANKTVLANITVRVRPVAQSIALSDVGIIYGYQLQLRPVITPTNAEPVITWSSQNPDIVSVNSDGILTARKGTGTTVVKAQTEEGLEATCVVSIKEPPYGCDIVNLSKRLNAVRELTTKTLENNR